MSHISFTDFYQSECQLKEPKDVFLYIYKASGGNPCFECAYNEKTKEHPEGCPVRAELMRRRLPGAPPKPPGPKTNAELAKELGVSKRQVAKMRARGEISDEKKR
jgi:hypothetical protein